MTRIITGLFDTRGDAERAVEHLIQEFGIDANQVKVHAAAGPARRGGVLSDEDRHAYAEGLRRGGIVVSAEVDEGRLDCALGALKECGAVARRSRAGSRGGQGPLL